MNLPRSQQPSLHLQPLNSLLHSTHLELLANLLLVGRRLGLDWGRGQRLHDGGRRIPDLADLDVVQAGRQLEGRSGLWRVLAGAGTRSAGLQQFRFCY